MSGGVLLPGNVTTADVNNGKTFSSNPAGVDATGIATLAQTGTLMQSPTTAQGSGTSLTVTMPLNVATSDSVVLAAYSASAPENVTAVNGLGATWSQICGANTGSTLVAIWLGTGCNGTTKTITLTFTAGASNTAACAFDIFGTLSVANFTSGNTYISTATLTAPANGFTVMSAGGFQWASSNCQPPLGQLVGVPSFNFTPLYQALTSGSVTLGSNNASGSIIPVYAMASFNV